MMNIGKRQPMRLLRKTTVGAYLTSAEATNAPVSPADEVLLPKKEVPQDAGVGDVLDVFVYLDSEDRPVATVAEPKVAIGQIAELVVLDVNRNGAYLDWGLPKDLFLPFAEQTHKVQKGDRVIVTPYLDKSGRICASMYRTRFPEGEEVRGVRKKAYKQMQDDAETVYAIISKQYHGVLPFDDKAAPDVILNAFGLSKAAFKRAVGGLYKERKIDFVDGTIRIIGTT